MQRLDQRLSSALVILAILSLGLGACGDGGEAGTTGAPASPPPAQSSAAANDAPATDGAVLDLAGIRFQLPSGWTNEQPSSPMRLAQAAIPGSGGAGQLTAFFFGPGGGGGVDANLNRWIGQMADAGEPVREEFESGEFLVTTVRQTGMLRASTMGTFPSTDQPGYALYGAVVEGPGGPWFFKAVAPEATMDEQAAGFRQMLAGIQISG